MAIETWKRKKRILKEYHNFKEISVLLYSCIGALLLNISGFFLLTKYGEQYVRKVRPAVMYIPFVNKRSSLFLVLMILFMKDSSQAYSFKTCSVWYARLKKLYTQY